ncbi:MULTISPECIES: replication initiation protein [unclassified Leptotrichia]|uniref:replication initiation protein n=1 Tax=unclassified Leptotrichia TaxID=2633022 RepID=UPI0003AE2F59|nr:MULTISPECIES: replication initiation protein [unclassified Leptotrichia]ERL25998.1 initiator RepB protein [Leptotrichia sp. oral taxon 225 str. F0581]WLD75410.1 replication initiation protein [Leptotrichia sp. HMT-225]
MNIYFSEEFTNLQTNIKLEFSKKITKNEKIFLKLLFFRIISDSLFLKKAEIRFEEILSTLEFDSIDNLTTFFKTLSEKYILFSTDAQFSGSFGIISSFILHSDYCQIFFTEEFKSCFSLKKNFFSLLDIEKFIFMNDSFSFNFYNNIIKNLKNKNEVTLPVSLVKMYLNTDNKYERFFDFEKHILKKAISDINTFTDFSVEYEKIKESKKATNKIISINFFINKSRQSYKPYDNKIYKMLELIKEKISNPEEIYHLFVLYVTKRGYKYVYDNINYVKSSFSEDFEKNLKKSLMLNLASKNLKLFVNVSKSVKSPIVLFYTLTRKLNKIKRHYPKIEELMHNFKLRNIDSISYFNDKDSFEFSNKHIRIFVKYYSDKKSIIEIYLPSNIIEKIKLENEI